MIGVVNERIEEIHSERNFCFVSLLGCLHKFLFMGLSSFIKLEISADKARVLRPWHSIFLQLWLCIQIYSNTYGIGGPSVCGNGKTGEERSYNARTNPNIGWTSFDVYWTRCCGEAWVGYFVDLQLLQLQSCAKYFGFLVADLGKTENWSYFAGALLLLLFHHFLFRCRIYLLFKKPVVVFCYDLLAFLPYIYLLPFFLLLCRLQWQQVVLFGASLQCPQECSQENLKELCVDVLHAVQLNEIHDKRLDICFAYLTMFLSLRMVSLFLSSLVLNAMPGLSTRCPLTRVSLLTASTHCWAKCAVKEVAGSPTLTTI